MELELQHQTLEGYRTILDAPLAQEETLECIVPDALPDASRIVCAVGRAFLRGRQVSAGSVRLSGTARVTVLYIPEGQDVPVAMDTELPFQCVRDDPKVQEGCLVHAQAGVTQADAQALNPRKLLIRVGLAFQVRVYQRELREITCDAGEGGQAGLEKQLTQAVDHVVAQVLEKPFLFSDVLRPPASRPELESLLCCRPQLGPVEGKAIGKKLICKGEIHLAVLYLSGGAICTQGFDLPFSQIFDLELPTEDAMPQLCVALGNVQCALQEGELAVSVEAVAQAVLWVQQPVTLMSDAYCTGCPLDVERGPLTLCARAEQGERREAARQFCESGIPARQVLDCSACVESREEQWENGVLCARVQLRVQVLYLSEDGAPCAVSYAMPGACEIPVPEGEVCRWQCVPVGEVSAVPVTGGLEVRCELEFCWQLTRQERISCVLSMKPGAVAAAQLPRPSLTIRMVGAGDTLWEIAKSCGSTIQDIRAANDLTSETVEGGTLLLVPIHRT